MNFNPVVSLGDVITIIGLLIGLLGLAFAIRQLKLSALTVRGDFLWRIFSEFFTNKNISDAFYQQFEYQKFKYIPGEFHGVDKVEIPVDCILKYFDSIGKLVRTGILEMDDIDIVRYEIIRCYKNEELHEYLKFLDGWYEKNHIGRKPYEDFRWLAEHI